MTTRPVIFISAVSKELRTARDLVAKALLNLGYDPKWQDMAPTETGDLSGVLRRWVDSSSAVIQIVGHCYGYEPPVPSEEYGRCSYTQYEALYARRRGKKVWYLFTGPDFQADAVTTEPEELRELQATYRATLESESVLRHRFGSASELEVVILRMRDDLAKLRRIQATFIMAVLALLLLTAGLVIWVLCKQEKSVIQLATTDAKVATVVEREKKLTEALMNLADAEMNARQLGGRQTPEELRRRAYTVLENQFGIEAGTLAKRLPAFALELYSNTSISLLLRANAAYALNKLEESEKLFVESSQEAQAALKNAQEVEETLRQRSLESLVGAGNSARAAGRYQAAMEHYRAAAALTDEHARPGEWAQVLWYQAQTLDEQGRPQDSEPIHRRALAVFVKSDGPEQRSTLRARNSLALNLWAQARYAEAEREHREILALRQRLFGPEDPDTLNSRNNLAIVLESTAKYAEAGAEYEAVYKAVKTRLGDEHIDTLRSLASVANTLMAQHKGEESVEIFRPLLKTMRRVLGDKHLETLRTWQNLTAVLSDLGKYDEVEKECLLLLPIRRELLGLEHPDTLNTWNNLANAYGGLGKYADAEREFRALLEVRRRVLQPKTHPVIYQTCFNLGAALEMQEKKDEAHAAMKEARDGLKQSLPPGHPLVKAAEDAIVRLETAPAAGGK